MPTAPTRYRFAEFTLSPARRSLRRGGREVPLIPRYLDLLILLVERRAVALPRREILDRVWADVVVSDGALSQAVRTLRRTLGETTTTSVTVSRHGYQFVCPVLEEQDEDDAHAAAGAGRRGPSDAPGDRVGRRARRASSTARPATRCGAMQRRSCTRSTRERRCAASRRSEPAPGASARAWAHLRDSRWDVAGAGAVPLLEPPAGPAAWAALVVAAPAPRAAPRRRAVGAGLGRGRDRRCSGRAPRRAGMAALGGSGAPSLLVALALVGALVAGVGAAGVGSGLAAAEATRAVAAGRRRSPCSARSAAAVVAFVARHLALGLARRALRPGPPGDRRRARGPGARCRGGPRLRPRHAARRRAAPPRRAAGRAFSPSPRPRSPAGSAGRRGIARPAADSGAASLDAVVRRLPRDPRPPRRARSAPRRRRASARAPGRPLGLARGSSSAPASPPASRAAPARRATD